MKLCIYCAGGLGKEVFDIADRINNIDFRWDEIIFVDDSEGLGDNCYLGRLFKFDKMLVEFKDDDLEFIIANGEPVVREKLFIKLKENNIKIISLIDPLASISPSANIGDGLIAYPFSIIASDASIGNNVLVNAGAIIGHDIIVGHNTVISPQVCIGGGTRIGDNSYIGMGSKIKEKLVIGSGVIVGMSSAVHRDVPDDVNKVFK
jgi:sugar O-acyltransferase (sialic acid O-acetyltransferase NeuD family)